MRVPFNRICQRDECVRAWQQLADRLNVAEDTIEKIENGYLSRQERCLRSLEYWATHDERADILRLVRILRSLGFKSLAGMSASLRFSGGLATMRSLVLGEIEDMA